LIPRGTWDAILAEEFNIGDEQAQRVTKSGEVLGFWIRNVGKAGGRKGGGEKGTVEFLPSVGSVPPSL